jgi:hypothetical protein
MLTFGLMGINHNPRETTKWTNGMDSVKTKKVASITRIPKKSGS